MVKTLKQHAQEMKKMAEILMPRTFPIVNFEKERKILVFKQRMLLVDGYEIVVLVNKSDYKTYHSSSVQIRSIYSPFLPFNLVCKLAKVFLGDIDVSYMEFFKNGKKLYCWNVRTTPNGDILPPSQDAQLGFYEGFTYSILKK